jgi:hypothetical protein
VRAAVALLTAAYVCIACGSENAPRAVQTAAAKPKGFVQRIDNQWFPLRAGTVLVYRGVKDGEPARDVVRVTGKTKLVDGVRCTIVDDRLYLAGRLAERTADWFAQDRQGTVWYFGESTAELDESGNVKSTEGSWQAGVNDARAGVVMPAHPRRGQSFRQEYYKGQAEDHFRVLSLSASVHVPYLASKHALLTKEWTPLEPDVIDHKLYVRGIGLVEEKTIKGGDEHLSLVSVRRR